MTTHLTCISVEFQDCNACSAAAWLLQVPLWSHALERYGKFFPSYSIRLITKAQRIAQ